MTFLLKKVARLRRARTFFPSTLPFSWLPNPILHDQFDLTFFLISLDKRVDMTSSKMRVFLSYSMIVIVSILIFSININILLNWQIIIIISNLLKSSATSPLYFVTCPNYNIYQHQPTRLISIQLHKPNSTITHEIRIIFRLDMAYLYENTIIYAWEYPSRHPQNNAVLSIFYLIMNITN